MRRGLVALALGLALLSAGCGGEKTHRAAPAPRRPPAAARRGRRRPTLAAREGRVLTRLARLGLPVYCGGRRGRYVALTFDDGPGAYTPLALRILRAARARATFFLVGRNLALWGRSVPREERLAALGDHTWTHPFLPALGAAAIRTELASTQQAAERVAHLPIRLFRPPYGGRDATVDATARSLGMVEVLWSIDSRDSEGANWSQIAANVMRGLRPGSIVLMHENRGQTIRALRFVLLPELRAAGWHLVSVPELLALDPPTPQQLASGGC